MAFTPLCVLNILLTLTGSSYLHKETSSTSKRKLIWQLFNIFPRLVLIASGILYMHNHKDNLEQFAEAITINVVCIPMLIHEVCCLSNLTEFQQIIDVLILNDSENDLKIVTYIKQNGVKGRISGKLMMMIQRTECKIDRFITIFMSCIFFCCTCTGVLYISSPVIDVFLDNDKAYRELPMKIEFPWDEQSTPNYYLTYILHVYFDLYIPCVYAGGDTLSALLLSKLVRQLALLRFILSRLDELVGEAGRRDGLCERDSNIVLADCVAHYIRNLQLCRRFNVIVQPYLAVVAFSSGFVICFNMFIVTSSERLLSLGNLPLVVMAAAGALHLGIYCALGQELINESVRLREGATATAWWRHSAPFVSNTRLLRGAVSNPLTLYIFGSVALSSPTYLSLVKTSLSYFTILRSVTEK